MASSPDTTPDDGSAEGSKRHVPDVEYGIDGELVALRKRSKVRSE